MVDEQSRVPGVAVIGTVTFDLLAPIARLPRFGELEPARDVISTSVGGAPGNSGMTLARLGVPTFVGCRVGNDEFGHYVHAELARECDVSGVHVVDAGPTSVTLVMVAPDGERGFVYQAGVNDTYCAQDVSIAALAGHGVQHLHVAYTTLLPALCGEELRELLATARSAGMSTSIDLTWDPHGRWMETFSVALPEVDIMAPNRAEALAMTGRATTADAAQALIDLGVRSAVSITLDADGSYTLSRDGTAFATQAPTVAVVDSTGAGDAFLAGWFAARCRGLDLASAIAVANAAASLAVTTPRACDGIPSWDEVARLASSVKHHSVGR